MKTTLLFAIIVFSQLSFATKWSGLEISSKVKLGQPLVVKTKSDKKISFDDKLVGFVEDISHLSYINVELYKVRFKKCSAAQEVSDLFLHDIAQVDKKDPVVVGIELKKGCLFEIYVEFKDMESNSLFNQQK